MGKIKIKDMFEALRKRIETKVKITDEDFEKLLKYYTYKSIKKDTFLLREGEICHHGIFVLSGCLSYYFIDEDREEKVVDLGTEGWWMGDGASLFRGIPTKYYIKAITDAEVILVSRENALASLNDNNFYLKYHYFEILEYRDRTDLLLGLSLHRQAEEKYKHLMATRPYLFQQIPLHYIASFLGITPSSLSRLRRRLTFKHNLKNIVTK